MTKISYLRVRQNLPFLSPNTIEEEHKLFWIARIPYSDPVISLPKALNLIEKLIVNPLKSYSRTPMNKFLFIISFFVYIKVRVNYLPHQSFSLRRMKYARHVFVV